MKAAKIITAALVSLAAVACQKTSEPEYRVCAFVWPSCHSDSLAEAYFWPEGKGEWEVIEKGNPRFEGHYQPKQPLWGQELDNDPAVVEKWIQTALKYGINTFIWDWYWFENYPFLESALNDGFLKAPSNQKMEFYIMWANHYVEYRFWNYHKNGADNTDIAFDPRVGWDQWKVIVDRVVTQYFHLPNYTKIDGCPVFAIFDLYNFVQGFEGDAAEAGKAIQYLRDRCIAEGFKGVHIQHTIGSAYPVKEHDLVRESEYNRELGVNSYGFYNMGGFDRDYLQHAKNGQVLRDQWAESFGLPVFPTVSIGWDDTPRKPYLKGERVSTYNKSPQAFATFLKDAKDYADAHAATQPKFILINSWNEWVEGSYLLPDHYYGFGYLEAVRDVMNGKYDNEN